MLACIHVVPIIVLYSRTGINQILPWEIMVLSVCVCVWVCGCVCVCVWVCVGVCVWVCGCVGGRCLWGGVGGACVWVWVCMVRQQSAYLLER